MELLHELWTRNSLDLGGYYFTGYYFVCKVSCSNSSLGGDYINFLLPRECLFKIEITVYWVYCHLPGFLLVPQKLSMKLGANCISGMCCGFLSIITALFSAWGREEGLWWVRGAQGHTVVEEAAAASAVLGIACKVSPSFQVVTEVL